MSPAEELVLELAGSWQEHGVAPSPATLHRAMVALGAALQDARQR